MKKRFWTSIVSAMLAMTLMPVAGCLSAVHAESPTSGTYGDNVQWTFDESTGNISFTGSGKMTSYAYGSASKRPWNDYADKITSATIGEGITNIGGSVFKDCINLTSVEIADTVTFIDWWSFSGCYHLTSIDIPESVTAISNGAFNRCSRLDNVVIPQNMNVLQSDVFAFCYNLDHLYIKSQKIVKQIKSPSNDLSNVILNLDMIYFESSLTDIPQHIKDTKPYIHATVHDSVSYTVYCKNEGVPDDNDALRGYIQFRREDGNEKYDMRFLVEGRSDYLNGFTSAAMTLTFTKNDGSGRTKTMKGEANKAYTSVIACGETITAPEGYGYIGLVIKGIGNEDGVGSVSASVEMKLADGTSVTYDLGSIDNVSEQLEKLQKK